MALDSCSESRPLIFTPKVGRKPLFFLHIPKTAGSSNNHFLRALYGPEWVETHVENLLPALLAGQQSAVMAPCVSGHIPLWAWSLYRGTDVFERVTLLRDPWARLVSHINWVAQYARGQRLPPGPGGAALGRVSVLVAQTDFTQVASLRRLMNAVKAEPLFRSFDNYQVRMLRTGRMDAMEKPMELQDLDVACQEISQFFLVGFCEDQKGFQRTLTAKLGVSGAPMTIAANRARDKVLEVENTLAREVFAPWIEMDMGLYGYARGFSCAGPTV